MRRAYRRNGDVCYRLSSCCFDKCVNCGFSRSFCVTCFCLLVFLILFFCIGVYLYLFETASLEIGSGYFFYFCLLLGFEVLLIVSGCITCLIAWRMIMHVLLSKPNQNPLCRCDADREPRRQSDRQADRQTRSH